MCEVIGYKISLHPTLSVSRLADDELAGDLGGWRMSRVIIHVQTQ